MTDKRKNVMQATKKTYEMKKMTFFEVLPPQWQLDVETTRPVTEHLALWATQRCSVKCKHKYTG